MRYLVRMVTPPGGIVLDPFCGSGSTGCAAVQEGFGFIGVEQSEEYCQIAQSRIRHYSHATIASTPETGTALDLFDSIS